VLCVCVRSATMSLGRIIGWWVFASLSTRAHYTQLFRLSLPKASKTNDLTPFSLLQAQQTTSRNDPQQK
jgi:hypothetical protein